MIEKFNIYKPVFPIIKDILAKTGSTEIVDLCSGGGGAATRMAEAVNNPFLGKYKIFLSDKYPNIPSFEHIKQNSDGAIDYISQSTDVFSAPVRAGSMRTIFSAFHHFRPKDAKRILANAVKSGQPVGIFEGGERAVLDMLGVILTTPLSFFFFTPFMRPRKLSRFIFTYLIPLIPITTIWDGIVSMFRMYTPNELLELAHSADTENKYEWSSGRLPHGVSKVIYLIGYPKH
jgi:hypothetical protein